MALGIYPRTKEHGRNISKSKMGHEVSKETREKISKKLKGTRLGNTCGFKKGNVPWNYMGGIGKNYPNQKQVHNQRESIRNWCISNQIHRVPVIAAKNIVNIDPIQAMSDNVFK